jgi:hypothetical protein
MALSYGIFLVAISIVLVLRGVKPQSVSGVYHGEPIQTFYTLRAIGIEVLDYINMRHFSFVIAHSKDYMLI